MPDRKQQFKLKILSPAQKYYVGKAVSLSATNKAGHFDILAGHVNFFSLLTPGEVRFDTGERILSIKISSGIIKAAGDSVTLFVNI